MPTSAPISTALRILSHFWLAEVVPADEATIAGLPELAAALPVVDETALTNLAVEYQRLFGFNLPPYESLFIDPSAMLQAPATARVQTLYNLAGWQPPGEARVAAVDHLGLEMLALADWGLTGPGEQLLTRHLALWLPVFCQTLHRLNPHPFYTTLSDLTQALFLSLLPETPVASAADLWPALPSPPVFRASGEAVGPVSETEEEREEAIGLRQIIKRLLSPHEAGLFLTREDIARLNHQIHLTPTMGDRYRMLETLFQQAGQYELVGEVLEGLQLLLDQAEEGYQALAQAYSAWLPYAAAWGWRVQTTKKALTEMLELVRAEGESGGKF